MSDAIEVVFHNMPRDASLERDIRRRINHLEHFAPHIVRCRVVIEGPRRRGALCRVLIDVKLPDADIVVGNSRDKHQQNADLPTALRAAFRTLRQKLVAARRVEATA